MAVTVNFEREALHVRSSFRFIQIKKIQKHEADRLRASVKASKAYASSAKYLMVLTI